MEHVVERRLELSQRAALKTARHTPEGEAVGAPGTVPLEELPIPALLSTLIAKVLRGDTDAIGLLETPETALLLRAHDGASDGGAAAHGGGGGGKKASGASSAPRPRPPTAVRAIYYSYTFSEWDALWRYGRWWEREPISTPVIFEAPPATAPPATARSGSVRVSPPQRFELIGLSATGAALALGCLLHEGQGQLVMLWRLGALAVYALAAAFTLTSDYPSSGAAAQLETLGTALQRLQGAPPHMRTTLRVNVNVSVSVNVNAHQVRHRIHIHRHGCCHSRVGCQIRVRWWFGRPRRRRRPGRAALAARAVELDEFRRARQRARASVVPRWAQTGGQARARIPPDEHRACARTARRPASYDASTRA
jgi:hypothetical protein